MKERPILFNGEMVRAILEGRKTQTRRVMKPTKTNEKYIFNHEAFKRYKFDHMWHDLKDRFCAFFKTGPVEESKFGFAESFECPYGQPGDRLWVRERFLLHQPFTGDIDNDLGKAHAMYYADDNPRYRDKDKWRPSIHMPRWASRITLEITGVRVDRLQDISEPDAIAEGIHEDIGGKYQKAMGNGPYCDFARQAYQFLWQDINGAESWAANPWVWVIEFKKC